MEILTYFFGLMGFCLLTGRTSAAVTEWTEPPITGNKDGSVGAATKINENLADATSTGVTLDATGATVYALTTATVNGVTFSIHASSGLLTKVSGTLDFETNEKYVIVATGGDGSGSTGTATVTLTLNDLNEAPAFLPVNDVTTVTDGTGAGTSVYTVNATDHDAGATTNGLIASYTIANGNTNTDFAISNAGVITVATGKTIARATTDIYVLQVQVADTGSPSLTGTTVIAISVTASSAAASVVFSMATILLAILFASLN